MSSTPVAQERRSEVRYNFCGDLPARLVDEATGEEYGFVLVDISRRGMGLLIAPSPKIGNSVRLEFDEPNMSPVVFKVCYVTAAIRGHVVPGLEDMKKCGFIVNLKPDETLDLVEYLKQIDSVMIGQ